jgi:NAD(P)-dependent dehydrogenase (short-subunit alcohol dehydrogenase family)
MGLAVAHALGRESTVLISDISQERVETAQNELEKAGVDCAAAICDVTDPASVRQLAERAQELGTVVSVIHTAGVSPSMGSAELILRINAVGTVLINQAFLEIAGRGMAMVNVASVAGHQLPALLTPTRRYKRSRNDLERFQADLLAVCNVFPPSRRPQLAYVLSKTFVTGYSKALAAQFGSLGARVLSVSPGSFDTAMGKLEASAGAGALAQIGAL